MLSECIQQLRDKVEEVLDEKAKESIGKLLTKAEQRHKNGAYDATWQKLGEAERKLGEHGIEVTPCPSPSSMLSKCIQQLRDKVREAPGEEAKESIGKLLTEAEQQHKNGVYDATWQKLGEAEQKLGARGIEVTPCPSPSSMLSECIQQLRDKVREAPDKEAKDSIEKLLTKTKELNENGDYRKAWRMFRRAAQDLGDCGIEVSPCSPIPDGGSTGGGGYDYYGEDEFASEFWALLDDFDGGYKTRTREEIEEEGRRRAEGKQPQTKRDREHYQISVLGVRRLEGDIVSLRVDYQGLKWGPDSWDVEFKWEVTKQNGKDFPIGEEPVKIHRDTEEPQITAELLKEGTCYIKVVAKWSDGKELPEFLQPKPLPLKIEPSGMEVIYRDKRRHNFSIVLAASLIALVFGMLARRVFSLTFGSFEEYLLAFAWGTTVYAGTEVVSGIPQLVDNMLKNVFSRKPKESGEGDE